MEATDEQLAKLAPYINGARPDGRGEVEMYCPLHPDVRRSASLNVEMGVWCCHAGCGGGSIRHLIDAEDTWVSAEGRTPTSVAPRRSFRTPHKPSPRLIHRWHRRLLNTEKQVMFMKERRGLDPWTLAAARIGWDGRHFKIPVYSPERELWNVRTWDPNPKDDRRKIWSVRGMGRARLYPASVLERTQPGDAILICEGEWDALLALQLGFLAVSRTDGAGKPWHDEWTIAFAGLRVLTVHDRDLAGAKSDLITREALEPVAEEFHNVILPYEMKEKHGNDLTDFILENKRPEKALAELLRGAD